MLHSFWARSAMVLLKIFCNITYQVEGKEYIPDEPVVVLCNHQSAWETIALQVVLPIHIWVIKKQLLRIPFFGWGLATLAPIAINRKNKIESFRKVMRRGGENIKKGRSIVIFPEGTRNEHADISKYQVGGIKLAQKQQCKILPLLHNSGKYWGKNAFTKTPGCIQLHIGTPISTNETSVAQIQTKLETWIDHTRKKMCV